MRPATAIDRLRRRRPTRGVADGAGLAAPIVVVLVELAASLMSSLAAARVAQLDTLAGVASVVVLVVLVARSLGEFAAR